MSNIDLAGTLVQTYLGIIKIFNIGVPLIINMDIFYNLYLSKLIILNLTGFLINFSPLIIRLI